MTDKLERAVLVHGCFWGMQNLIRKLTGLGRTKVGYMVAMSGFPFQCNIKRPLLRLSLRIRSEMRFSHRLNWLTSASNGANGLTCLAYKWSRGPCVSRRFLR
ncbi:peptide-methionine (S)-S-oxide reductase [Bradyrhizobium sp. AUGA SZCCT0240]|nr:peptide-methionine (S)-S-oxide reductase [Bradyrhizobium sp. AUGA SZCCT0240]